MHVCVYALWVYVRVRPIKAPLHSPPAVFDLPFKLFPAALQAIEVESVKRGSSAIFTPDRASAISCLALSRSCLRRSSSRSWHTHTQRSRGRGGYWTGAISSNWQKCHFHSSLSHQIRLIADYFTSQDGGSLAQRERAREIHCMVYLSLILYRSRHNKPEIFAGVSFFLAWLCV